MPHTQKNCFEQRPNRGQSLCTRSEKAVRHPLSFSFILAAQLESFPEKTCLAERVYAAPRLSAGLTEPTKSKRRWYEHQLRETVLGQRLGSYSTVSSPSWRRSSTVPGHQPGCRAQDGGGMRGKPRAEALPCKGPLSLSFLLHLCLPPALWRRRGLLAARRSLEIHEILIP